MIKNLVKNSKKKKGFTLIELIIVIAVIAIIAAFAIPNFIKVQNNSKIDADINLGRTIAHEVEILVTEGTVKSGTITVVTNNSTGVPTQATADAIAQRIQNDIKTGTLKLQAPNAGTNLSIVVDSTGNVTSITNTDSTSPANSVLYTSGTDTPTGVFVK